MHRALTCFFAVLAVATATFGPAVAAPDFRAAHTIAVVSLLGDELNFDTGAKAVAGAGFDAVAERAIIKQIKTDLHSVTVTIVDAPRAELLTELYPTGGDNETGMGNVRQALRLWAAEHPNDYIVIFRKQTGEPFPAAPGFSFFGIGLAPKNGKGVPVPVALLNVTVLDGTSLSVVTDLSARDTDWSQFNFKKGAPEAGWLPRLIDDTKAMLQTMAPALVHGAGL